MTRHPLPAPPNGELRLVDDVPEAFAALVATEFASSAERGDERFGLVLSGGETARACYERLGHTAGIDWPSVDILLGDERCVPAGDPAANQRLVRESLLEPIGGVARFHAIDCDELSGYGLLLDSQPLDVIHLGLGPDGHTASLFPGSQALESPPGSLVVSNEDPSGRNPYLRATFTFEAISRGRLVVFTVAGAAKHEALARVMSGEDLPATRVRAARVLWLCDREALDGNT
jgi:6-phosphogluconolactonase